MNHSSPLPSGLSTSAAAFDTGPLSWVIGEIRDALGRSAKALQDAAGRSAEAQPTLLLHAKTHLHQAHGALQMVDVDGVDRLTGAAEQALDRFKDGSLAVMGEQAAAVGDAYQALVEYLEELLGGTRPQPLRLFPYYRALQELLGAERVHPGEMLVLDPGAALALPAQEGAAPDLAACRARFEKALLPFLKSGSREAAGELREALAPIARAQHEARTYAFWLAMQTVADLVAQGRLASDIYLKQLLGQINLQLRRLVQGHTSLPEAMLRDALFFVAQAAEPGAAGLADVPAADALPADALPADARLLLDAYGIEGQAPRDYLERRYGRIDRAALQDAKEALALTKEGWDRIAGEGAPAHDADFFDALGKLAGASEKLGAPALAQLLRELGEAARQTVAGGRSDEFGMEMAAAMLFVEHGLDQVRQLPEDFGQHAEAVGRRLLALAQGEIPPEAPRWQGELAHELQQGQTVAVLAGEIRTGLRQVEKLVDEYHENPARSEALEQADPLLHQLAGALAILDQEQAVRACTHVRERLRALADGGHDEAARARVLENLAQNVGALGFFVDALARNPDGARRRFRFDAAEGLFREQPIEAPADAVPPPQPAAAVAAPEPASSAAPAPEAVVGQGDEAIEAELLEIFIGEAHEVLAVVADTLPAAHADPGSQQTLTRLRRAFHTLKGSGRMVGLEQFAAAAAAIEKTMNLWLAESRAATPDLLALLDHAHAELSAWVAELAAGAATARSGAALAALAAQVQEGGAFELAAAPVDAVQEDAGAGLAGGSVEAPAPQRDELTVDGGTAFDAETATDAASAQAALPPNVVAFPLAEENIKRIGGLEIPLPLYNIYLGETEELVNLLARDFADWRAEPLRAVSAQALKASHTLGGTSATVGFHALREIGFALEEALQVAIPPLGGEQHQLLDETVERVRIMRQVFSLGELAPAQPELLARLQGLRDELGRRKADSVFDGADAELAQRLDALFAATYDSILADPPLPAGPLPVPELAPVASPRAAEPQALDPAVAAVDDLFDTYFDDPFGAPSLEQAVAPPAPDAAGDAAPEPQPEPGSAAGIESEPELEPAQEPESAAEPDAEFEPEPGFAPPPVSTAATSLATSLDDELAAIEPAGEPDAVAEPVLAAEPVFSDELDPDLLPVFMEEAADLLPQIGKDLRAWQQDPSANAVAQGLLRALHTVKGSARMAGAMRLGQHTHALETQVENMLHAGTTSPAAFDELLANYDQALLLFEQLQQPGAQPAQPGPAQAPAQERTAEAPQHERRQQDVRAPLVRVRADILDRMVNQAGEVSIARSKLETQVGTLKTSLTDFSDNLERLRRQLREVEMQAESQIASRLSIAGEREFDPLEFDRFTRLQELTRMMAESVNDVASFHEGLTRTVDGAAEELASQSRLTRELQRDLMRVRMVPFASLSERLFRVARQTAKETDKRVNLDIRGGAVEIDRSVLERMAAPFEHLLRNAIVHGIEARARRLDSGKPETGELLVQVGQQGNEVQIRFGDDGAGLDLERIRAKGQASGLLGAGAPASDAEIAELIFEPGFSTADALTELAGRGVGMDVVRSEARALGGRVEVASEPGRGAAFTIHLPLTLAVNQVVLVASGARTYALPANLVGQVLQVREAELLAARGAGAIQVQGEAVPLRYLPELLNEPGRAGGARTCPVLLLGTGVHRLALQVDEVLGNREVVIKNVGPQLARMAGIAGATVLGSGEIVLILNPLLLPAHGLPQLPAEADALAAPAHRATVMVVDDSLTVRRVTQRLLEREGYRVLLAKDGVEALEQIQAPETRPDLMLVDIEMPRMDGFDLTRNVRGNEATHGIPIIMITSRTADKHRNYALGLGVDAYFGKPFQEEVLLAAIGGLLA